MKERTKLLVIILLFMAVYYIPWNHPIVCQSGLEAFMMLQEYAKQHVLTCLIPEHYIHALIGGNSLRANLFASVSGALMYFATLTEVPILQGLIGSGMGQGPDLALLLAGPALSLPNMIVLVGIMGIKKTAAFCAIIVVAATIAGMGYGLSDEKTDYHIDKE